MEKRDWTPWLIFGGALLLFGWRLGAMALWDNDETTYAEIAKEMLQTGDWITLHFRDKVWFCHPPLYYWLVALCDRVLDYGETAARLPSLVFGAATLASIYVWGRTLFSRRVGLLAAMVLGLNFQFYLESRMALLDTLLHFFLVQSLIGFTLGWQRRRLGYYWMFFSMGMACLSKGPFGLLFAPMIVIPFALLSGQGRRLLEIPWILGGLLAGTVGLTWYAVETMLHGRPFVDTVFVYFMLKRMTVRVQGQGGAWWLYLPLMLFGLFPWSFFLPGAMLRLWQSWREKRRDAALLLLVGIVVPFAFFTIAETKLPNYIMFAYFASAVAVGWYLAHARPQELLWPALGALGTAALFIGAMRFWAEARYPQYDLETFRAAEAVCMVFAAGALAAVLLWKTRWGPALALASGMGAFLLACATFLGPRAEAYRPVKPLGQVARAMLHAEDKLAICDLPGEFGLIFYADHPVVAVPNEGELLKLFNSSQRIFAIVSRRAYEGLAQQKDPPIRLLTSQGNAVLVSNQSIMSKSP